MELPVDRYVYSGFQAELLSDMGGGGETIIILHPTVWPPAAPRTAGDERGGLGETALPSVACNITVCLPAFDVSAYNLPWRRWAAENGAKLVFSPQGGIRIDAEQNREFWRELLFNEQL